MRPACHRDPGSSPSRSGHTHPGTSGKTQRFHTCHNRNEFSTTSDHRAEVERRHRHAQLVQLTAAASSSTPGATAAVASSSSCSVASAAVARPDHRAEAPRHPVRHGLAGGHIELLHRAEAPRPRVRHGRRSR